MVSYTPIYSSIGAAGPLAHGLMQPLHASTTAMVHAVQTGSGSSHEVGLIQTGLYGPCRALPRPEARPNVGATPVAGMLAIACWHVVVLSKLGGSHDMVQPAG